jgi:hypothetical protein
LEFAGVADCAGRQSIIDVVRRHWDGGRILILPNGMVVKPHQTNEDDRVGRSLIGQISGSLVVKRSSGTRCDLGSSLGLYAGDSWPGPSSGHLTCVISESGALKCSWYHPTDHGRDYVKCELRGADEDLAEGFREARPWDTCGRVQICYGGHVLTRTSRGAVRYVGWIDPETLGDWRDWIGR